MADKDEKYSRLVVDKENLETQLTHKIRDLENERKARSKIQAELTTFQEENKIGGVTSGMSAEALAKRNKELEEENRILES